MIVPLQVFFESFVCHVFLLDVKPRQIRFGILGSCLVLCRFSWTSLHFGSRLLNDSVDERKSLHARVCQVILLLVLVKHWDPMRLRLLNKGSTPLDGCFFALKIPGTSRTGNVRYFVSSVVDDDVLVVTEEVCMQKVFDTLHRLVSVRLFLDENRVRLERPLKCPQMRLQRLEQSVGMLRWDARNVPLSNETTSRIDQTHRKVLYPNIDA